MIPINVEQKDVNVSPDTVTQFKSMFEAMDKYNDVAVNADLYLKALSDSAEDNKEVSIRMNMPGKDIFIAKQAPSLNEAAQQLQDALKVALRRHKEMHKDRHQSAPSKFD